MRMRLVVALLLTPVLAAPLQAGIIFGRKAAPVDPKTRVPELLAVLKGDHDASKRSKAADELKGYDAAAFPDIVPALINAMNSDAQIAVRIDAAQALGKVRPVSQTAGEALESASDRDSSMRVRLRTQAILLQYHWAGYKSAKKEPALLATEPAPRGVLGRFLPPIRTTPDPRKAPKAGPDAPFKPLPAGSTGSEPPLALSPAVTPVPELRSAPPSTPTPLPARPVPEGPILP